MLQVLHLCSEVADVTFPLAVLLMCICDFFPHSTAAQQFKDKFDEARKLNKENNATGSSSSA